MHRACAIVFFDGDGSGVVEKTSFDQSSVARKENIFAKLEDLDKLVGVFPYKLIPQVWIDFFRFPERLLVRLLPMRPSQDSAVPRVLDQRKRRIEGRRMRCLNIRLHECAEHEHHIRSEVLFVH